MYELQAFPGFYAVYVFAGCILLLLAAQLLRTVVRREEGYYD